MSDEHDGGRYWRCSCVGGGIVSVLTTGTCGEVLYQAVIDPTAPRESDGRTGDERMSDDIVTAAAEVQESLQKELEETRRSLAKAYADLRYAQADIAALKSLTNSCIFCQAVRIRAGSKVMK